MDLKIPEDMINKEMSQSCGGTVVSIRDLHILLGATDEQLAESDRIDAMRKDILAREPWRDKTQFVPIAEGSPLGFVRGSIDWSGTEYEPIAKAAEERMREMWRQIEKDRNESS